ncbi:MAG: peptidylprolyl isomerase [Limnohabitans sp.]
MRISSPTVFVAVLWWFVLGLSELAFAQALKPRVPKPGSERLNLKLSAAVSDSEVLDGELRPLDFIVAVVDNEPITNQEVSNLAAMVDPAANKLGRENLLREAMENLINESAQLQVARQSNMQISPSELQLATESTAKRNQISVEEMKQRLNAQGITWERYRNQIKRQMLLQRVREREVSSRIKIQDHEVEAFLQENSKEADNSKANIHIAHILITVSEKAQADELASAKGKAEEVLRLAKAGEDFGKLAAKFSQAPDRTNGGQLGLRSPDRYPSLFVDTVLPLPVGGLVGPIRSGAGFHVLKLVERKSPNALPSTLTQTRARHILLRPGNQLSQDAARAQLAGFRKQIEAGAAQFEELARQYSQDASATQGGDLGWANPGTMVPEFEKVMDLLRPGEISDPLVSRFGVHLIQVTERREEPLTLRDKQDMARNILRERKFDETLKNWEREIRGRAYVEYRDPPL